jgi:hypothetical protein
MPFEVAALENLPNAYVEKINLMNDGSETFKVNVSMMTMDEAVDGEFVWSEDDLIMDTLKICVVLTSNDELIQSISSGKQNPHPKALNRNASLMEGTQIASLPVKRMKMVNGANKMRFKQSTTFIASNNASSLTLFAFAYVDTVDLSKMLGINLGGPLAFFYGPVTSENIIVAGDVEETTFVYEKENRELWSGAVHQMADGRFMKGSFHGEYGNGQLVRREVANTKILDRRGETLMPRSPLPIPNKANFSELSISYNNEADLIGFFSLDFRNLILTRTKQGRKMFNVSSRLLELFASSVQINSLEIRRQQVKFTKTLNKLGTTAYNQKLIGSYETIATTIEQRNLLINTDELSQVFITPDNLIKTYQFIDLEMSENTRGEFRYEAVITFADKSDDFLRGLVDQMVRNISTLKTTSDVLYRLKNYDRKMHHLKEGVEVPPIFAESIDNYYQNLSIVMDISDEERDALIAKRKSFFTSDNYVNTEAQRFIAEYSNLATKFKSTFDIKARNLNMDRKSSTKKHLPKALISTNHVFEATAKFDNVRTSYDYLGIQSNKTIPVFTKDSYNQRANQEVARFFDTSKSTISDDFYDLSQEEATALRDTESSKTAFLAPLSFKHRNGTQKLSDLAQADTDGISMEFIKHVAEKQVETKVSTKATRKRSRTSPRTPKVKKRINFKKKRVGRVAFNFKTVPIKVSNLKPEEYLDVSNFLGNNSEMINVDVKLDEVALAPQTLQVINKVAITEGLSVKREKKSFDLQEKNNIFEQFKASEKFSLDRMRMLPLPIKSLLNSRSRAAKNNILASDSDILKDAETKVSTEMIFHSTQTIEYFTGFSLDSVGLPDLSAPNWKILTPDALENSKRLTCRMKFTEIPELGIKPAEEFKLLAQNSTFIITDEEVGSRFIIDEDREPDLETEVPIQQVSEVIYASSNPVVQSSARRNMILKSATPAATSRPQTLNSQASTGGPSNAQTSRY